MFKKVLFSGSARYVIRINGYLDESMKDILENYVIQKPLLTIRSKVTTLDIEVKDQAALCGLLNKLYYDHYIILSVQQIEKKIE